MDRDTSEYSSTKAPETRPEAHEDDGVSDSRLIPGGSEPRADAPQGMAALDPADTPDAQDGTVDELHGPRGGPKATGS